MCEESASKKREPGKDILVHGGARFVQSLSSHGLTDEYRLIVHPVALSGGLSLFAETTDLSLLGTQAFPGGAVVLTYGRSATDTARS